MSTEILPRVVCAWCKKTLKHGSLPASHTICDDCGERVLSELSDWTEAPGSQGQQVHLNHNIS